MLQKKIHEIEGVCFDYDRLNRAQQALIEQNNTQDLAFTISGLPLIYYSTNEICSMNRKAFVQFIKDVKHIEDFFNSDKVNHLTVKVAIETLNVANQAMIETNNKFCEHLQNELSEIIDIKSSDMMRQIISDMIVADRYICFNATSKSILCLRNFSIRKNELDFMIQLPLEIGFEAHNFRKLNNNVDAQLLTLRSALISLLKNQNSQTYLLFCDWINKCEKYVSRIPIYANYFMPYVTHLLKSNNEIEIVKQSRYHSQKLYAFADRNWIGEKLTSLLTYKTITKHHRTLNLHDDEDIVIAMSRHFIDMAFTNVL